MQYEQFDFMMPFVDELISARKAIRAYFQREIKKVDPDISYEMFQVLSVLWRKNELNQQEIANTVQKGKASLTPLIDNLSRLKLVTRTEDAGDRRNKIISLTNEGTKIQRKFDSIIKEFSVAFNAGVPEDTVREFTKILSKMTLGIPE